MRSITWTAFFSVAVPLARPHFRLGVCNRRLCERSVKVRTKYLFVQLLNKSKYGALRELNARYRVQFGSRYSAIRFSREPNSHLEIERNPKFAFRFSVFNSRHFIFVSRRIFRLFTYFRMNVNHLFQLCRATDEIERGNAHVTREIIETRKIRQSLD